MSLFVYLFQEVDIQDVPQKSHLEDIAGLYIEGEDCIYITCQVNNKNVIRKLKKSGSTASNIILPGVGQLRGISRNGNCFYVLDKVKEQVLKYSSNWMPLRKISMFNDPYGILAHGEIVLVCDTKNHRVCVLDDELNHLFDIPDIQEPMGIAVYKDKYFVTSRQKDYGSIVILDINVKNRVYEYCTCLVKKKFGRTIRGICATEKYLYITELEGRILCLEYVSKLSPMWDTLECVAEHKFKDQRVVDIAHDDSNHIYFTMKDKENKCSLEQIFHNERKSMTIEHIYTFE